MCSSEYVRVFFGRYSLVLRGADGVSARCHIGSMRNPAPSLWMRRFTVAGDIGTGNVMVKPKDADKDADKVPIR